MQWIHWFWFVCCCVEELLYTRSNQNGMIQSSNKRFVGCQQNLCVSVSACVYLDFICSQINNRFDLLVGLTPSFLFTMNVKFAYILHRSTQIIIVHASMMFERESNANVSQIQISIKLIWFCIVYAHRVDQRMKQ